MKKTMNKDEVFAYLDDLRESGETNMFGSPTYVEAAFGVSKEEARAFVSEWMKTFPRTHKIGKVA